MTVTEELHGRHKSLYPLIQKVKCNRGEYEAKPVH